MTTTAEMEKQGNPRQGRLASRRDGLVLWFLALSLGIAMFTLWRESETEPYHIDELRQVRPYARGLDIRLDASFAQDQPPLDPLVGAWFQSMLGVGDVLQRSHSMLAGLVALIVLATLLWRAGLRVGVPAAILVLAVLPGFVSMTAYARPYALPLALMAGWALCTELWLENGSRAAAGATTVISLLLPLSRVFEPPAFLVLASVTLLWFGRRRPEWGRRPWWPVGSAVLALITVELPVFLRLREQLTAYQGENPASFAEQWRNLIDDSLPRFADMFVNGWLALGMVVVALSWRPVRRRLSTIWWIWPMFLTAVSFAVAFHIRTQPSQPFFGRYAYFWLPVFAVVVAVVVDEAANRPAERWRRWGVAAALIALVAVSVTALVEDFRTPAHADYQPIGELIEARFPPTTALVYAGVTRPAGLYESGYAGSSRYTSRNRQVFSVSNLIPRMNRLLPIDSYILATNGPVLDIPGWRSTPVSEAGPGQTMTLYTPDRERSGIDDLAADLAAFGKGLEPRFGAELRVGAASVLFATGENEAACDELDSLLTADPALKTLVEDTFASTEFADEFDSCSLS